MKINVGGLNEKIKQLQDMIESIKQKKLAEELLVIEAQKNEKKAQIAEK